MTQSPALPIRQWIFLPAVITLAITLARLFGELLQWSPIFFSRAGGGAGAIIGIVWLVPILGMYFALKLIALGDRPSHLGRAFGLLVLAGFTPILTAVIASRLGTTALQGVAVFCIALFGAIFVAKPAWPSLGRVMWAYGLAARIPVILVMLVAIFANWGTHYDVAPPNFPAMSPIVKWLLIGVFPQVTLWMGFTVVCGMLFGVLTAAVRRNKA